MGQLAVGNNKFHPIPKRHVAQDHVSRKTVEIKSESTLVSMTCST